MNISLDPVSKTKLLKESFFGAPCTSVYIVFIKKEVLLL